MGKGGQQYVDPNGVVHPCERQYVDSHGLLHTLEDGVRHIHVDSTTAQISAYPPGWSQGDSKGEAEVLSFDVVDKHGNPLVKPANALSSPAKKRTSRMARKSVRV